MKTPYAQPPVVCKYQPVGRSKNETQRQLEQNFNHILNRLTEELPQNNLIQQIDQGFGKSSKSTTKADLIAFNSQLVFTSNQIQKWFEYTGHHAKLLTLNYLKKHKTQNRLLGLKHVKPHS